MTPTAETKKGTKSHLGDTYGGITRAIGVIEPE